MYKTHTINKVQIFSPQDPTVGMFPVDLTIDLQGYETDDPEAVREVLRQCFAELYDDGRTVVSFAGYDHD